MVACGGVVLGSLAAGVWVIRTPWFAGKVRERIIQEAEKATGGRVELDEFRFDWKRLTAVVRGFRLHGTEPADAPPLFQAASVQVGLRIISVFERKVDLASLRIEKPSLYILVRTDGSTNIPRPKLRRARAGFLETVLDLKIQRFEAVEGTALVSERRFPIDVTARSLRAELGYDGGGPRYEGSVTAQELRVAHSAVQDLPASLVAAVAVEKDRIVIRRMELLRNEFRAEWSGEITRLASPQVDVSGKVALTVKELLRLRRIPLEPRGKVEAEGRFSYSRERGSLFTGVLRGADLATRFGKFDARNVTLHSQVRMKPAEVEMSGLVLRSDLGDFTGSVRIADWRGISVRGDALGIPTDEVARRAGKPELAFPALAGGTIEMRGILSGAGLSGVELEGSMVLGRKSGGEDVRGVTVFTYRQEGGRIRIHRAQVSLPSSALTVEGEVDRQLRVDVETHDLEEALRVAAAFGGPASLPLKMSGGVAHFHGTVTGGTASPRVSGQLEATGLSWEKQPIDALRAQFIATRSELELKQATLRQGAAVATASGRMALNNWKIEDASAISGRFEIKGAALRPWVKAAGVGLELDANVGASGTVKGTIAAPVLDLRFDAREGHIAGEHVDRFVGQARVTASGVELVSGTVSAGNSVARLEGAYNPLRGSWKSGVVRVKMASERLAMELIPPVRERLAGLRGTAKVDMDVAARVESGGFYLRRLDGVVSSSGLTLDGKPLGSLMLEGRSRKDLLRLHATAALRGSKVAADAEITLDGDYPAHGEIRFQPLDVASMVDLASDRPAKNGQPPVATGTVYGRASFSGPLRSVEKLTGAGEITSLEVKLREIVEPGAKVAPLDLTVRNDGPIQLDLSQSVISVRRGRLTAQNTDIRLEGLYAPARKSPLDLRLQGEVNLATLRSLKPELRISGRSVADVTLRGSLQSPEITGRLELKDASVFLADVPMGFDHASGMVTFDRNRVNIQRIEAESGGGRVTLQGFLGLGGPELTYRLQATAEQVRLRYPEGFSTLFNAKLNFTGTRRKSLLSGAATVLRSSFSSRTDMASLFQPAVQAVAAPVSPGEFLQGLQFDIQIVSGEGFEIQTAYTQNVQAEARLQLRGTAAKPSLLGRLSASEGEVDFFGTRYRINRAEIHFYNTSKIEPVLDVALETRVRAIAVNISLSGTLNRLNVTYRSDPPLSSSEILALLTVGRTPASERGVGTTETNASDPTTVGSAILGQALSAPVSSRLQRFFGVSRVKIDPLARGLEGTPQARITVEQQLSRDVTLTYVTSLQRVQQQIVRVEINLNRQWSLVALRDENGAFGVDFFYRKGLK